MNSEVNLITAVVCLTQLAFYGNSFYIDNKPKTRLKHTLNFDYIHANTTNKNPKQSLKLNLHFIFE